MAKRKAWTVLIVIVAVVTALWLINADRKTEWLDKVPDRFIGNWALIKEVNSDNYGIRSIHLSADSITLKAIEDQEESKSSTFPIRKVSFTLNATGILGQMVIFYGLPAEETTTDQRLQVDFGPKESITVRQIVATGTGEDHWFDVGEFGKIE